MGALLALAGPGAGGLTVVAVLLLGVVATLRYGGSHRTAVRRAAGGLAAGALAVTELALWRHRLGAAVVTDVLLSQLAVLTVVLVVRWLRRLPWEQPPRVPDVPALAAERTRIARELHDTVGHGLTVVSLHARALRARPDDDRLALVDETAQRAMTELATLMGDLRRYGTAVSRAKSVPLTELTRDVVAEFRRLGLRVRLVLGGPELRPPPVICQLVDRALREALINVIKHGRDGRVEVEVDTADGIRLRVTATAAEDAAAPAYAGSGTGLCGLAEQVAFVGGTLESGRRGRLFSVTLRIPLGWTPAALDASA